MRQPFRLLFSLCLCGCFALKAGTNLSKAVIDGDKTAILSWVANGEKIDDLDKWGCTPLIWAVYYKQPDIVKWLLVKGANPNIQSKKECGGMPPGATALGMAAYHDEEESIKLLLKYKADPLSADLKGKKPIDYAKMYELKNSISLLENPMVQMDITKTEKQNIADIEIILESNQKNYLPFFSNIQSSIKERFLNKQIKTSVLVVGQNPLGDEAINKSPTSTSKFIMKINEIECRDYGTDRIMSVIKVVFLNKENNSSIWESGELTIRDTGRTILTFRGDIVYNFASTLIFELEANSLI
ncbi:MAG: ankyrin repeat domain-containing protein [Holophaga sp.]|nr:ankyrin repeat domain-containing protein [Holophaga sp.]